VLFDARTEDEDDDEALLAAIRYASCISETGHPS
jgi:hypothetical protein